jgi:CRP/FNR family transcriptional regulator
LRLRLAALVSSRRSIKRGDALFQPGAPFDALFEVHAGCFKTSVTLPDGRGQVTGFQLAGELIGLDGIGAGQHASEAVALEDSQVCVIPFAGLEQLSRQSAGLQHQLHKLMSQEIVRNHAMMLLLGGMCAERRLAAFLLNLTQRLRARGFSATAVVLRMSREEIGSYLGLKLETVSRTFSKFQGQGLLHVKQRDIRMLDLDSLQRTVDGIH